MDENLRRRIMDALSDYLATFEHGSKDYDRILDLFLDVKWAGSPLKECNPKGY